MRIALFLFGGATPFGRLLSEWTQGRKDICLFTDNARASDDYHYLRFAQKHNEQPFDLVIYDVDDSAAHAALFPFIAKYPGVLFCNDIALWDFARSVSHESRDPWGTKWIFRTAAADKAEELTRLAETDVEPGELLEKHPLAVALARRSAGVVVPNQKYRDQLSREELQPSIEVVPNTISNIEFASFMTLQLTTWKGSTANLRNELKPIEHAFQDLYAVELGRIMERYGDGPQDQLNRALERLRDLFEGATNSATAKRGDDE